MVSRAIKQDKDSKDGKVKQKPAKLKLMLAIAAATLLPGAGGRRAACYFGRVQDGAQSVSSIFCNSFVIQ